MRAAIVLALVGGFGLGGLLGGALAFGVPMAGWWPAAVQVHGHVQLVGWAGLMVLGVGLHFMPRLRGAPLRRPERAKVALGLLAAGLVVRLVAQPAAGGGLLPATWLLPLAGLLELAGAVTVAALLLDTWRRGPPLEQRAGLRPVLPFFAVGFASLVAGLGLDSVGLADAALAGEPIVPGRLDQLTTTLLLEGFLVPIALGMSMRLFPLYFRTQLPNLPLARAGLALWLLGLLGRLAGASAAAWSQLAAVALLVVALGVFGRRTTIARGPFTWLAPVHLHVLAAYAWLVVAAIVQTFGRVDAARHALGAGFVTLLIFGVGAEMLPGFARRRLRHPRLPWLTLGLGSAAALLRVLPGLLPTPLPADATGALFATAGLCGVAAVAFFALAVPTRPRPGNP